MIEGISIRERCEAIGLQRRELASEARCAEGTIHNIFTGKACRTDTLARIGAALVARELAIRDHLLALHPVQPNQGETL
jgi:predicted transcriptional regulator